jgi:hypothetical protein
VLIQEWLTAWIEGISEIRAQLGIRRAGKLGVWKVLAFEALSAYDLKCYGIIHTFQQC